MRVFLIVVGVLNLIFPWLVGGSWGAFIINVISSILGSIAYFLLANLLRRLREAEERVARLERQLNPPNEWKLGDD
ncbi:MAG: hypothetical protein IJX53_08665 [Clostridia bacterium]|nr:hypothetical protein [Clostridia bacterium]